VLIYLLTFKNGKRYVGQTVRSLPVRVSQHRRMVKYGSQLAVHCAWRKHGEPEIEVLGEYGDMDSLHAAEKDFIASLNTLSPHGYNIGYGGETAPSKSPEVAAKIAAKAKGRGHTDTAREQIADSMRDRWDDPEYRKKVSAGLRAAVTPERRAQMAELTRARMTGRAHSEETKAKLRRRKFSEETRRKMSEAAKARKREPHSEETKRKMSANTKAAWLDPELTARRVAAIRAAKSNPENAALRSQRARNTWADPAIRERRLAAMRAAKR
jgi:group I intron endonuclease